MARVKAQGKHIARLALPIALQRQIIKLCQQGLTINKISQQLGSHHRAVYNYVRKFED
jgi:DNA-binding NarL/FixJ family response regulator